MPKERACANSPTLSDDWDEVRDCLKLALDQVETGQRDLIGTRHLVAHLRPALKAAHRRLEALK